MATISSRVLPFGIGPNSDHAILCIDISFNILTGLSSQSIQDTTQLGFHNLWSTDIKAAEKYIELVQIAFAAKNIIEHIAILVSRCQCTNKCTQDNECILNKINKIITWILLKAKKECKKASGHAWSPLLAIAGCTVIVAKWHLSDVLNHCLNIRLIDHAQAIIQAKQQVKEAYKVLHQVQQNVKMIRNSFLMDRAEHLANTQQMSKANAVHQILQAK